MKDKQEGFSLLEVLGLIVLLVVLIGIGFFVVQKSHDRTLSAAQIEKKFGCNRITEDVRQTDVFCGNPKFYNDPDGVTYEDYYKYYGCAERLKGQPPAESAKTIDPGYYQAYYNCKDRSKLEAQRLSFISELKKIKSAND